MLLRLLASRTIVSRVLASTAVVVALLSPAVIRIKIEALQGTAPTVANAFLYGDGLPMLFGDLEEIIYGS